MRCGCASVEITPDSGMDLTGYVARRQPSDGIHDPLMAKALYVEEGGAWLVWLHADVLGYERADIQRLKAKLENYFGVPPEGVIVTATHAHAGPGAMELLGCGAYDPDFVEVLHDTFVGLVAQAIVEAEETTLLFGEGHNGLAVDRRGHATAHTDPRLPTMAWRREDGSYVAVLALYAMHNVAMGAENREISADVAGRVQRRLSARLPGAPPVLFVNGACGNVNPPSVGPDFERVATWGDALADAATAAIEAAQPLESAAPRTALVSMELAPRPSSGEDIAAATEWAAAQADRATGDLHDRLLAVGRDWAARMASPDVEVQARNAAPVDIHAVTFGDIRFVGIGAEVFSVMNDDMCRASGRTVYVVGYANGNAGYLCPEPAFDEGGYETDDAWHYYGTRRIPRWAHERVRDAAVTLLESMEP